MSFYNAADVRSSSTTDVWLTPPEIVQALGPFDLDPSAACNRPWDTARNHFCIHDDGLAQPWDGLVFLNPPYGRETPKWLKRLSEHPQGGVALTFARTDTRWAHDLVFEKATSVLFVRSRISFRRANGEAAGKAGAPSWLIAYGEEAHARLASSNIDGVLLRVRP